MKLQNKIFGIDTREAYNKVMAEPDVPEDRKPEKNRKKTTPVNGVNLADYVFVPEHNLYVAKKRTHQGSNWYEAHQSLHQENARMMIIREFVDFLALLKTGNALDGLEQRLSEDEVKGIYKDITEKKDPYRAEWLDADFKVVDGRLHINYNHRNVNEKLQPQNSEPLEGCVMENSYVDLIGSANTQGLPTRGSNNQEFYYWKPLEDNNSVAWFLAGSGRVCLGCGWDPGGSVASLGVRAALDKG